MAASAVKVTVLVVLMVAGLKLAVIPAGNPVTARVALPEKPFAPTRVMTVLAEPPETRAKEGAEAERLKVGFVSATTRFVLAT